MTDYIGTINLYSQKLPIAGDMFDDAPVLEPLTIINSATLPGSGSIKVYSLDSWLPNDGFDYEVTFRGSTDSSGANGSLTQMVLYSGTKTVAEVTVTGGTIWGWRLNRSIARSKATVNASGNAIIPIFANDRNVSVYCMDGTANNTTCYLFACFYRRIGHND